MTSSIIINNALIMDILYDHHVHCGQYENIYFQPAYVVRALSASGIKKAWLTSTTSNISWSDNHEKKLLIEHIEQELEEAMLVGSETNIDILPLYWVIPQRHQEGESISDVMSGFPYRGFKIHPRQKGWELNKDDYESLLFEICEFAYDKHMPVLIHTGVDAVDSPERFEKFFSNYSSVRFVLAHCRKTDTILRLFSQYNNVFGDCALCGESSFQTIYHAGYYNRMYFGTDFPISYWFETDQIKNMTITYEELFGHYQRLITNTPEKHLLG